VDRFAGSIKTPKFYLPQLLLFILADEICNNYFLNIFSGLSSISAIQEFVFYFFFLIVQICLSPIQSGYSDFYCRKKSLLVSLFFSALSLVFAFFYFEYLPSPVFVLGAMILIKGGLGNNLPLSWAGIADTQTADVRLSLGLSTSAIALGYLSLIVLSQFFFGKSLSIIVFSLFVVLIFICFGSFFDLRDQSEGSNREAPSLIKDIKLLMNNFIKVQRFRKGLLTFMFWEISFYSAHMLDVDLKISNFKGLTLAMILGYLLGVVFLWRLPEKKDEEMISIGYFISIISFFPIFIFYYFISDVKFLIIPCYFFYALGAAFLAPSLFSTLSKERRSNEQGKIYGLLDSTDTIAFLLATIITMAYNWLELKQVFIIFFSFLAFLASWWPYAAFKKSARV
jgi:MFS family permease